VAALSPRLAPTSSVRFRKPPASLSAVDAELEAIQRFTRPAARVNCDSSHNYQRTIAAGHPKLRVGNSFRRSLTYLRPHDDSNLLAPAGLF